MKRIALAKYGFVKTPELNFEDDGNHFEGWKTSESSRLRISKLVSNGDAFLSCDICGELPYKAYSNLPHYRLAGWDLNGVCVDSLTDERLQQWYNDCLAYEKEYIELEQSIAYPTLDALKQKAMELTGFAVAEVKELEALFAAKAFEAACKTSEFEWRELQRYMTALVRSINQYNPETYPQTIYKKAYSFTFMEKKLEHCFYYKQVKELLAAKLI